MENDINYTAVGAFIIALVAAVVFAIIWLSSGFNFAHHKVYMIYMKESVTGLNIDSPVEFNGVSVGEVKNIGLNQLNPHVVELLININSDTPVTEGTVATLNTRGVTGFTYVALKDVGTDMRPLTPSNNQPYPVIKTAPSIFLRLDTALSEVSANLRQVADSIKSVLDKQNQRSIRDILSNITRVTNALAENSEKMDLILKNTADASKQFQPLLQSTTDSLHALQKEALPATYQLINNLNDMTKSMSQVTNQIKQNPSILIRGSEQRPLGPGESK